MNEIFDEIFKKEHKHLVWHNELHEDFLLLKYAEVFEYSETLLGLHCWSPKMLSVLGSRGLIITERWTDDPFCILTVDKCHLLLLLSLGSFKKRPDINGKWVKGRLKLLGHKDIKVYRPKEESEEKEKQILKDEERLEVVGTRSNL